MIFIKPLLLCLLVLYCTSGYMAQTSLFPAAPVVAGDNLTGPGNSSVSFSIGQIDYVYISSNDNASVSQGVQQALEIFVVSIFDVIQSEVISVFPNPTSQEVNIKIENANGKGMIVQFYDANGKLLMKETITQNHHKLGLENFPKGMYILEITQNQSTLINYKIIKS